MPLSLRRKLKPALSSVFFEMSIWAKFTNFSITDGGRDELHHIFASNNFPYPVTFTDEPNPTPNEPIGSLFETTITFNKAKKLVSSTLCAALEKDEDDWIANRNNILNVNNNKDLRPDSLRSKTSRGLVNASLACPENMRNYLSLFEEVILVPPPKGRTDEFLKGLDITQEELLGLVEMGKVHLLLPNSIEKYELTLVEGALERRKANIQFTRRINAFTLQEIRKRNPLFFPAVPTLKKQTLLRTVDESLSFLSTADRNMARSVIAEMGHGWLSVPNAMNETNVNFISQFGIVNILDAVLKYHTKKDFKIELMAAAPMVELAAATGAVLMPTIEPGFDLSPFCQIIANFYSGVPNNSLLIPKPDYTNFAVEEILTISQHVPILEFAKTFNSAEINRFRNLVLDISNSSASSEDIDATIAAFNYFVKQYENNKSRLSAWNIGGFVLNQMGKASGIPYSSWVLKLLTNTVLKHGAKFEKISSILDSIRGHAHGAYPSAILVSKMRDKIKKKI